MKHLVILAIFLGVCSAVPLRIANGTDAKEGEFKYMVSIRYYSLKHWCGGTIINKGFILTAYHCACLNPEPSFYTIQYGSLNISSDNERSIKVESIKCGQFNWNDFIYDVAVLQLATPLPDDNSWEPVVLSQSFDTSIEHSGTAVGWGILSDRGNSPITLQKLNVTTLNNATCGIRFNNNHHVCITTSVGGVCSGDSGSALVVDGAQVGIASFINGGCGSSPISAPNVFARVPTYYNWIIENSRL